MSYNEALAKAIKNRYPKCKIIIGGAETPNKSKNFFVNKPYIDYLVHQEGSLSFTGLLQSFIGLRDEETVPGISINRAGKTLMLAQVKGLSTCLLFLALILWAYLINYQKGTQAKIWNAIIETNRGCPLCALFVTGEELLFQRLKNLT